jgi:pyruvate dehydrogenase E1 component alpha subunit
MLTIRLFEERVAELYTEGHIYGFCHLYIGQEAVVVGINSNLQVGDSQITSYRDHAHMISLGVDPKYIMAELCGRDTGCSHGKGGSMHMYSRSHNFYGGNGIVGAQVSIGTGIAFSHKYRDDGGICVVYFGDGAVNQGQVYESFNMASLWKLPVLYVIENNQYAMGTSVSRSVSGKDLTTRGDSFGIPTLKVDGMDLFDVVSKSGEAIDRVRNEQMPIILHVDTYRYRGHSMSDPSTYRTREEVNSVKNTRDPLVKVLQTLMDFNYEEVYEEISHLIDEAAKFAVIESIEPESDQLYCNVLL